MTLVVKHANITGAAADPDAIVDLTDWDDEHALTGAASPSQGGTGVANNDASTVEIDGAFPLTINLSAATEITLPPSGTVGTEPDPLFILATGQSNFAHVETLAWSPDSRALVWNNTINSDGSVGTAFGALSASTVNLPQKFASDISAATGRAVYLLNVPFSGQAISHWLTGTGAPDAYDNINDNITDALAAAGVSKVDLFLWWQGESDTSNASYVANFETMIARFRAETWFPYETPIMLFGLAPTSVSGDAGSNTVNNYLQRLSGADADRRRFIYTASLPSSYWADTLHLSATGYFHAGAMAASSYLNGVGRASIKNINIDPVTGDIAFDSSGTTYNHGFLIKTNNAGVTPASVSARAYGDGTINTYHGGVFHGGLVNGSEAAPTQGKANQLITGVGGVVWTSGGSFTTSSPSSMHYVLLEDATPTANGSAINWYTTPIGSPFSSRVNSLSISPDGTVWGRDGTAGYSHTNTKQTKPFADVKIMASGETQQALASVGYGTNSGGFRVAHASGSLATPTATAAGVNLGFFAAAGFDGTNWTGSTGLFRFYSAEAGAFSGSAQGTNLELSLAAVGATSRTAVVTWAVAGSYIGAATGTSKGVGTLNVAAGVYDNGTGPTGTAGTGYVRATSPTLVTPVLGTPASGNLSNCTALPIATGVSGLGANVAAFLATPSSANLAAALTDETGSGAAVFATSPTLTTPNLGTPSAINLSNELGGNSVVGRLAGANFNSTADQAITFVLPSWATHYRILSVIISNPSTSLTTAAGGFYTATSKGGTAFVAASQVYSALTTNATNTAGSMLIATVVNSLSAYYNATTVYLSLTTPQGATATADVTIFLQPLP